MSLGQTSGPAIEFRIDFDEANARSALNISISASTAKLPRAVS